MPTNPKIKPEVEPVPRINPVEPLPPDIQPDPNIEKPTRILPEIEPIPKPEIFPKTRIIYLF